MDHLSEEENTMINVSGNWNIYYIINTSRKKVHCALDY